MISAAADAPSPNSVARMGNSSISGSICHIAPKTLIRMSKPHSPGRIDGGSGFAQLEVEVRT